MNQSDTKAFKIGKGGFLNIDDVTRDRDATRFYLWKVIIDRFSGTQSISLMNEVMFSFAFTSSYLDASTSDCVG